VEDLAPRRPGRPARPVTRDHLLRVAREAFAELGYAGASMGDIAARAGIRKSSLFHHFATKDELYRDALGSVVEDIGKRVQQVHGDEGPLLERFDRATYALQRYLGEHPVAARLLLREFVDGPSVGAAGDVVHAVMQSSIDLIEKAIGEGLIPRQDPRHLAMSLSGVHFLFFSVPSFTTKLLGKDVFSEEVVEERARLVCAHLRRLMGAPPA
jgi:AcrR family transcriptional regulator